MSKEFTTETMLDAAETIEPTIAIDETAVEKNNEPKKTYDTDQIDSVLDVINDADPISKDMPGESVSKNNDNENHESSGIGRNKCVMYEPSEEERKKVRKYRATKRNALCLVIALIAISMLGCIFICCTMIAAVGLTVNEITYYTAMCSVVITLLHMWSGRYIIKSMSM